MMSTKKTEAWTLFQEAVGKFLGNVKASNSELLIVNTLDHFFPKNIDNVSEKQGKRFHWNIKDK